MLVERSLFESECVTSCILMLKPYGATKNLSNLSLPCNGTPMTSYIHRVAHLVSAASFANKSHLVT